MFGLTSATLHCTCVLPFVKGTMFSYHGASGSESSTTLHFEEVHLVAVPVGRQTTTVHCVGIEFVRMRRRERSLLATIALCGLTVYTTVSLTNATIP